MSIKIAIVGVGNCATSLLEGIEYYKENDSNFGLITPTIGGYKPCDIEPVLAFDIDSRKVGKPLGKAVYSPPNCAKSITAIEECYESGS